MLDYISMYNTILSYINIVYINIIYTKNILPYQYIFVY